MFFVIEWADDRGNIFFDIASEERLPERIESGWAILYRCDAWKSADDNYAMARDELVYREGLG